MRARWLFTEILSGCRCLKTRQCVPLLSYGVSKLTSEHLLRIAEQDGLRSTLSPVLQPDGPGQNLDNLSRASSASTWRTCCYSSEVPVTGSLERFRDLVHVDDVVTFCTDVVERGSTPAVAYNVGCGKPITVRELLAALVAAAELPKDFPIRELPGSPNDQFGL